MYRNLFRCKIKMNTTETCTPAQLKTQIMLFVSGDMKRDIPHILQPEILYHILQLEILHLFLHDYFIKR